MRSETCLSFALCGQHVGTDMLVKHRRKPVWPSKAIQGDGKRPGAQVHAEPPHPITTGRNRAERHIADRK